MIHLILLLLIFLCAAPAQAQTFTDTPLCLTLDNKTGDAVLGHIETAEYRDDHGKQSWHRHNFRIPKEESQEVCSTGPFFDDQKLRVVVKTIMPLYTCLTSMGGTVTITREPNQYGFKMLMMDCPEEK